MTPSADRRKLTVLQTLHSWLVPALLATILGLVLAAGSNINQHQKDSTDQTKKNGESLARVETRMVDFMDAFADLKENNKELGQRVTRLEKFLPAPRQTFQARMLELSPESTNRRLAFQKLHAPGEDEPLK